MSALNNLYEKLKNLLDEAFFRIDLPHSKINNCDWYNHIYSCPSVRYGHLEYFKSYNDAIEVVHCVIFPSYYKALPIFGFDAISLGGKITGVFCDYTPSPYHDLTLQSSISLVKGELKHLQRDLPGWTEFFSPEFIAISPKDEYESSESKCLALFKLYIAFAQLYRENNKFLNWKETEEHINGQNRYSIGQRKNSKTQKALAKYIGEDASKAFIDNVLFPIYKIS
jgi:phycocyanobilin:ferredoxin oxidoreductase